MAAVKRTPGATTTMSGTIVGDATDRELLAEAETGFVAATFGPTPRRTTFAVRADWTVQALDLRVDDQTLSGDPADRRQDHVTSVTSSAMRSGTTSKPADLRPCSLPAPAPSPAVVTNWPVYGQDAPLPAS